MVEIRLMGLGCGATSTASQSSQAGSARSGAPSVVAVELTRNSAREVLAPDEFSAHTSKSPLPADSTERTRTVPSGNNGEQLWNGRAIWTNFAELEPDLETR